MARYKLHKRSPMCFRFCCALLCALILGGCTASRTVYVPTEIASVRTDSAASLRLIDRLIIERDTVRISVTASVNENGDTTRTDTRTELTHWRERASETHDTIFRAIHDSIHIRDPYPVEVVREVERNLHWWQNALIWTGRLALILVCAALWLLARRRK